MNIDAKQIEWGSSTGYLYLETKPDDLPLAFIIKGRERTLEFTILLSRFNIQKKPRLYFCNEKGRYGYLYEYSGKNIDGFEYFAVWLFAS